MEPWQKVDGSTMAETVNADLIAKLVGALDDIMAMGGGEKRRGHAPACQHGYWISQNSPRPAGDPHSEKCIAANAALAAGKAWLDANTAHQAEFDLFSAIAAS